MGNNTTKKSKKKVIKVGVGKPYIRGGKTYTSPRGVTDRTGKLKTIHNLIDTVYKQKRDKKITAKERDKMVDAAIDAMKTQMKNKTYGKP